MKWRMPLRSMRSSSQSTTFCTMAGLPLSAARHDDLFVTGLAAQVHDESLECPRWRARHDVAAQVVRPVVAGAPELRGVRSELHRAIEVRAHGAERADVAVGRADDDARPAAELENPRAVEFERRRLPRARACRRRFAACGRNQEPRDG